jgi:hypothetical protein
LGGCGLRAWQVVCHGQQRRWHGQDAQQQLEQPNSFHPITNLLNKIMQKKPTSL